MTPLEVLFYATSVYALPSPDVNVTTTSSNTSGPSLPFITPTGQTALLWTSIGLAVVTSFWQGLIVTIVTITEDQGMWTFRFRIARYEHWWWTVVSVMLSTSFILIIFSFLSGNSNDSLGVLTLSTATAITIVRYAIPAWRNRTYIQLRWLSWTGPSRTGIASMFGKFCRDSSSWRSIQEIPRQARIVPAPSDEWGWAINPPKGIWQDPTALLQNLDEKTISGAVSTDGQLGPCVYDDGYTRGQVSLLWGEREGFRRRVSRAINSIPNSLLSSVPSTYDGFNGTGLCLAMGILGRNKGLAPFQLVFDVDDRRKKANDIARSDPHYKVTTELEATSAWFPRPNKVMRSFYQKSMEDQYAGLGPEFVSVAVELALILLDCPPEVTRRWLDQNLEQQSMELNILMSNRMKGPGPAATPAELQALYRASYTSMIISLNYFDQIQPDVGSTRRPDLTCFALLWLAEAGDEPKWWKEKWVETRLKAESNGLKGRWKRAASWLLGLGDTPPQLDLAKWPVLPPKGGQSANASPAK
ncbi:hypothetical protein NLJ89_g6740 [Agrocybe chaxingu]|uniref:Uncharacterized protein n=1 Tax=Agrocybe chaxingu TaxID=84603 RepID=A0A9W8K0A2_9AGAR|nr:hypothetical protein NLJ89_g6740 [Agrocybe chaxingu]